MKSFSIKAIQILLLGLDALVHGLDHRLQQAGTELRTLTVDVRESGWIEGQTEAVQRGIDAGVDAIVVYVLDPLEPADTVAAARTHGIPVFTFERPRYPVAASLVYANFNQGVYMAEYLASLLPSKAEVAVIGGPEVIDDIELVLGSVHGVKQSGLTLLNDPFESRYRNPEDVAEGGRTAAGRAGEMKLVSRNGSPKAVEAVVAERSRGTWDIGIADIGATVGDLVTRVLIDKEDLQGALSIAALGRLITQENAHTCRPWKERVPHTPLREGLDQLD